MENKFLDTFLSEIEKKQINERTPIIGLPMNRVNDMIQASMKHIYEEHGLTRAEMDMLATLHVFNNGLTAKEVSERLLFTSGGMSKVVKKLEFKNLIYKKASSEDKRSSLIYLTEAGAEIVEDCIPKFRAEEGKFFEILNETEIEILEKAFKKILNNV
ncbi:MarR family winged helix-turn-helix transcriptional regulator [Arcobacter sp. LA11]|uniref:MarR family winged helix-turn-helix transcriptional regulator n=1 Tax=Arcobacter sp. LA11 TaxID=1898176 RepID=UPI0015756F19|nr:MarR family transcriptional regulator [Arcobacter sp. LA11]